jgi:hypothetical protein
MELSAVFHKGKIAFFSKNLLNELNIVLAKIMLMSALDI